MTTAADLQPGDIFGKGKGTETVTRIEDLGPHAVIIHTANGEYGTFARSARFEVVNEEQAETLDIQARDREDARQAAESKDRSHALHARPTAGAPARNQYGTFQVSYASEKQTAYIRSLMDRKDLSQADPKKVDVAKLREQVAANQVNKKAASSIIDTLLALPDATLVETLAPQGRPATDKQKAFVRTLLAEREGNETAEAVRDALNIARTTSQLNAAIVSDAITRLLELPKTTETKAEVPAGRYALPAEDGHYVFYKVDRPTEGKWAGYTFVKQLIGSVGSWDEQRLSRPVSEKVLGRLASDPEEAARMFGIKAKACGMCASPLSNTRSRAAGYGETCAANHGFFYPSEAQAAEILEERGEA